MVSFCPLSTFHSLSIQDPVLRIVLTRSFPRCCLLSRYRNRDNRRRCWEDKYLVTENLERVEKRKFNSFNVDLFFFLFRDIIER